ncbi:MAG: hypothetical protein ACO1RX_20030 [Candidatus Sericytochromatia bacterium]
MKNLLMLTLLLTLAGCSPLDQKFTEENRQELWTKVAQSASQEERELLANYVRKRQIKQEFWIVDSRLAQDKEAWSYMVPDLTAREIISLEKIDEAAGKTVEVVEKEERNKHNIVAGMKTLQVYLETYAVDWGGVYPETLSSLYIEANKGGYFKGMINALTRTTWGYSNPSGDGVVADASLPCSPGLVRYKPIKTESAITKYDISACDESGELKHRREVYTLTNY